MKPWTAFWLVVAIYLVCDCIVKLHELDITSCDHIAIEGGIDAL